MNKPIIIVKFTGNKILGEKGRILFVLLNAFSGAGYPIKILDNLKSDSVGEIGSRIYQLPNLSVIGEFPQDTANKILLYDELDKRNFKKQWLKTVRVRFDIFSTFSKITPILFPFPVHPVHIHPNFEAKLSQLRNNTKCVKLFFSGDMKGYNKNHISFPKKKLPRLEIVNLIRQKLPERTIFLEDNDTIINLFTQPHSNNCLIIDTGKTWIDDKYWLDYLSKADFFLAPPGIVMPMCHNIIEAMAVGAIPLTNYPEWFQPNLKHMVNCITFSNKKDLTEKVDLVLNMNIEQIKLLRQNVISYYEKHLTANTFIQTFQKADSHSIDILMMNEQYVLENARKLNRNSFIINDSSNHTKFLWQRLLHLFS